MLKSDSQQAHCGTCNYPLAGLEADRCPECGSEYDLADRATYNSTGHPINWLSRFLIAAPAWPAIALAVVLLPIKLWELHPPELATRATWYYGWYFTCAMIVGIRLAQTFFRLLAETQFERRSYLKRHRSRCPAWPFLLVILLSASWIAENRLPMRWAFEHSRAALDELAARALTDPAKVDALVPASAGVFNVSSIVVLDDQTVILYTCESTPGWSKWGFARMPHYAKDLRDLDFEHGHEQFPFQGALRIDGDWFIVYDRYWAVKDGWS